MVTGSNTKELREQIRELQDRLDQAEDVLRAIRHGEVDALVVSGEQGEQVFTLQSAERPYRLLIEAMNEGAVTLNSAGVVLYCNQRFAVMVDLPLEQVLGANFAEFIADTDLPLFDALLEKGRTGDSKGDVALKQRGGRLAPAHLSLNTLPLEELEGVSIVVTDLTEPRRHAEMIASGNLARSILDQAAEAMVVCDEQGRIIHASRRAYELCGCNPMLRDFDEAFSLVPAAEADANSSSDRGTTDARLTFSNIRDQRMLHGIEVVFPRGDGETFNLLLSADAVLDLNGVTLGWVVNLTSITELKRAEREREDLLARERLARQQAEESSRLKDEFLANVSHELRTPLNAMLGWSRLLRVGGLDDAATARAIETIERNANVQNQLIEDLLDVSRIITGNLRLDIRSIDPASFIDAAIQALRPAADAKEIVIQHGWEPESGLVRADAGRMQQVVWNLLSNAIKFTPRKGRVSVKVESVEDNVVITVSDSGAGIDGNFLPYVFDRFRQADGTSMRRHGGLGLGLAIVRQLVELHGGTVGAESSGELGGATFRVQLPRVRVPGWSADDQLPLMKRAESARPREFAGELEGLNILVIDDEPDTQELIKVSLSQYGAIVETAGSSAEALTLLKTIRPAVILGDIGMPVEDGYVFIRKLRALPPERGGQIPAVAMTAYTRPEDRIRALNSGYQIHLAKPVEISELVAIVANVAGRA